ncbi:MAG: hypothetical protein EAZ92_02500 [Candidatus Kapaibacterium sp.]|nr:MAG: hypothetical protein EAZ92_02500 [Candidatus Kapabacteria bacterium]
MKIIRSIFLRNCSRKSGERSLTFTKTINEHVYFASLLQGAFLLDCGLQFIADATDNFSNTSTQ